MESDIPVRWSAAFGFPSCYFVSFVVIALMATLAANSTRVLAFGGAHAVQDSGENVFVADRSVNHHVI